MLSDTCNSAAYCVVADYSRRIDAISNSLGIQQTHVASLVYQQRALASMSVDALTIKVQRLASALAIPVPQALVMASRQIAVLDTDADDIISKCEQLSMHVQLPVEQIVYLVARQPALLDHLPEQLRADCDRLASALGASPRGIFQLLSRLSSAELKSVLGLSHARVREQIEDIIESLGLPGDSTRRLDVWQMIARNPGGWGSSSMMMDLLAHECSSDTHAPLTLYMLKQAVLQFILQVFISAA